MSERGRANKNALLAAGIICMVAATSVACATTYHLSLMVDGMQGEATTHQIFVCSFEKNGIDDILLAPVDEFPGFVTADAVLIDKKNTRYKKEGDPHVYTTALPVNGSSIILPEEGVIILNGHVIRVKDFAVITITNVSDLPPFNPPDDHDAAKG